MTVRAIAGYSIAIVATDPNAIVTNADGSTTQQSIDVGDATNRALRTIAVGGNSFIGPGGTVVYTPGDRLEGQRIYDPELRDQLARVEERLAQILACLARVWGDGQGLLLTGRGDGNEPATLSAA